MSLSYSQTFSRLRHEKRLGFCPFAVLGDADEASCLARVQHYIDCGADFLELGIPFSDPMADGPSVQAADVRALHAGTTLDRCFSLLEKIRAKTSIPIGVLTYANVVLQRGIDVFYETLRRVGVTSVLVADVPLEEISPFAAAAKRYSIDQIFIVSDASSLSRLRRIEQYESGFLYVVSTTGVTGARDELPSQLPQTLQFLKQSTKLPLVVGFGISTPEHLSSLKKYGADGAIVGSALVDTSLPDLNSFLSRLYDAT